MKKFLYLIMIAFVLLFIFLFYPFIMGSSGFDITIKNHTDLQIEGLKITYHNIEKEIEIPAIKPDASYSINIDPKEDFGENSMTLYYHDQKGNRHDETIIGYFEKGYSGKVNIEILSIDSNRELTLKVEEKIL